MPRIFKNFEVIIRAAQILQDKNIHFYLTFDGTENKYAKRIYKLASELKNVHFLGYLNATEMVNFYQDSDIICFPSKLETWGLPLSEAKTYKNGYLRQTYLMLMKFYITIQKLDIFHLTMRKYLFATY
ncbi:glycosyltransferase [Escherichia coli]